MISIRDLEYLDQAKVPVVLNYRLSSGKIQSIITIIREIGKKNKSWFVLTETGEPIPLEQIISIQKKK